MTFRLSLLLTSVPLSGAFGGLLASGRLSRESASIDRADMMAATLEIDSIGTVRSWRMIFLVEGIVTSVVGITTYFLVTNQPQDAGWLTPEERDLAVARI